MVAARYYLMSVGVALLLAPSGPASAQQQGGGPERHRPRAGLVARLLHLMPPAFAEELHLSPEQREKIQQLDDEFKQRRRALLVQTARKVAAILNSLEGDNPEPAPILAISHEIIGGLLEIRRTRVGYQKKMLALLTKEQRERYEELRQRRPRERPQRRRARGTGGAEAGPWVLLAPEVQRQLRLSAEQRRKLDELRHEWDTKVRGVLTPEQQKRYDELTAARRHRGGPKEGKSAEPKESPRGGKAGDPGSQKEPVPEPKHHDFGLKVEIVGSAPGKSGERQLVDGQKLEFRIAVERDAYVGVWNVGPDGLIQQIFPNDFESDHLVRAGKLRTVPGGAAAVEYTLRAAFSGGPEWVWAVASTERWKPPEGERSGPYPIFRTKEQKRAILLVPTAKKAKVAVAEQVLPYLVQRSEPGGK